VTLAYKDQDYPNVSDDSRCVLCHQPLSQEAKGRLLSFEEFVKGEMQKAYTSAAMEFDTAIQSVGEIPASDSIKMRFDAAGLQQDEITAPLTVLFSDLQKRKKKLPDLESEDAIPVISQSSVWIEKANKQSANWNKQAENYEKDAQNDNRDAIKKSLNSLKARQWLSEHREVIEQEINKLKLLGLIQKAKRLTNTKSLSQKKGKLAEALITNAFVQRFNAELKTLGASRIKVDLIKSKVSKGRVLHKLQLRGASHSSLSEILSEGESRIVSIAAFLADVTGKNSQAPFIFDDPISSLDQNYEEAVVRRLIDISNDKQVIIFTHRLSLLGTIKHFAEKESIKPDVVSIRATDWGTGEPAPIPLSQSDLKSALNVLINQRYQTAKKANDNGDFEQAEIFIKSICSDFRTLVERAIENDLLCGVVQRFQRPVHTLKLKDLAKLRESDCEMLDSLPLC
jgi:energy-coupling factor transporter ATP-binding protein EcfA2